MYRLKSIKLYFFSILKLFFLNLKNYYLGSNFYNKKLITFTPDRIFYSPSTHLCALLTNFGNEFYKISDASPSLMWKISFKEKLKFKNLHSFLWLAKIDRKNSKLLRKILLAVGLIIFLIMIRIHGKWKLLLKELLLGHLIPT